MLPIGTSFHLPGGGTERYFREKKSTLSILQFTRVPRCLTDLNQMCSELDHYIIELAAVRKVDYFLDNVVGVLILDHYQQSGLRLFALFRWFSIARPCDLVDDRCLLLLVAVPGWNE